MNRSLILLESLITNVDHVKEYVNLNVLGDNGGELMNFFIHLVCKTADIGQSPSLSIEDLMLEI